MLRHLRPFSPGIEREAALLKADKADQALRLVEAFENQGAGWFWETNPDGTISYLTPAIEKAFSVQGIRSLGAQFTDIFSSNAESPNSSRSLRFHLSAHSGFRNYPVQSVAKTEKQWWSISGEPRKNRDGKFCGFVGSGTDLSEKRQSQADIFKLAYSDGLTGLANRERMKLSLGGLIRSRQSGFTPTALLLIDLDRFKAVNDTLGHQVGDELLKQVAQRLLRIVGSLGEVGRVGGDEFQVVIASDQTREIVDQLAQNIIDTVMQPYFVSNHPISIGCSIGMAISPEHGDCIEAIFRNADLALYSAKDAGRGCFRTFTPELLVQARRRKDLENDLRSAISNGELHLVYQPVVSTLDLEVKGFEALLRWNHPKNGAISPGEFIPIAEDAGLIGAIGEWVLRTATADAAKWPIPLRVAVNVSAVQFANRQLPAIVTNAIAAAGLPAERLELEITESVFLNEDGYNEQMFKALKGIGVRLALDDFGTGYSSLGYLKSAPFDKIKIDQSFVRGAIMSGNRNAAIIRAIVTLSEVLNMETTAEGVEQQDEVEFIRQLGCSHIQGFVYGKGIPSEDVLSYLIKNGCKAQLVGHKVSRGKRERVMRAARVELKNSIEKMVVRDISAHGVMLENASISPDLVGIDVLIELIEGSIWQGNVRWAEQGRMGLYLDRAVDKLTLSSCVDTPPM